MKRNILLTFCMVFFSILAFTQDRTITGNVTDGNQEPVIGATVRVPDTNIGAITDVDGNFSIDVPADATELQVSYVGMEKPMIIAIDSDFLEVNIGSQEIAIDDIIVTGYSATEKRNFTGSAKTVGSKVVEDKSTADITESLAGEVAGLTVINGNGQPGTPATVRIRGFGSVNGNRDPLYVVDGAIYEGAISAINPADIESTTVLKDASATALYGSRGANGVIVINTKKGRAGTSEINVDFKLGRNYRGLPYYDRIQSPEEYMEISWEGMKNAYGADNASNYLFNGDEGVNSYYNIWDTDGQYLIDPSTGKFYPNVNRKYTPERRRDIFFNDASRRELNVNINGGEGKTTYSTSFGYLDDIGYFLASNFDRLTGRARITHKVKPWLSGDLSLGYARTESNFSGQSSSSSVNGFYLERMAPPIYGIYERNPDGTTVEDPIFGGPMYDFGEGRRGFSPLSNIAAVNRYDIDRRTYGNFNGNGELKATFLKDFDFLLRLSYQNYEGDTDYLTNKYYGQAAGVGDLGKRKDETNNYTFLQMLTYNKEIGDHNIVANFAHENTDYEYKYQYNGGTGLMFPFGTELSNLLNQNPGSSYISDATIESYFGFADYDFAGKYFVTASLRRDGSSRFRKENRWGTFPALGLGWVPTEEDFFNADWVDFMKLRLSYGLTGDSDGALRYAGGGNLFDLSNISGTIPAFPERTVVDDNLTWEKYATLDIGLEFDLIERISGTVEYYNRKTTDLFFDRRVGPSAGYALVRVNDGEMRNSGLEFDLTGNIVKKNDFTIDLSILGTTLKNELTKAPIDPSIGEEKAINDNGLFGWSKGHSIYDYYVPEFTGVDSETGWSQWTQYYDDKNSNGEFDSGEEIRDLVDYQNKYDNVNLAKTVTSDYNTATQFFTGQSAIPKFFGATRLEVGYKGFSLTTQLIMSSGGHGFDGNYQALMENELVGNNGFHSDIRNRWQNPGDVTNVPKLTNGQGTYATNTNSTSTRFITSSNYLTLNNVRFNYAFAERLLDKVGIEGMNVWVSGDNLWAKTKRQGFFPFVTESTATDREAYDPLSTATFGINFKF